MERGLWFLCSGGVADEAVVFAVGGGEVGVGGVLDGLVVAVGGVGEHSLGFLFAVGLRGGGACDEGGFSCGLHEGVEEAVAFGRLEGSEVFGGKAGFDAEFCGEVFDLLHVGVEVLAPVFAEFCACFSEVGLLCFLHGFDYAADVFACGFAVEAGVFGVFVEDGFEVFGDFQVFR